MLTAKEGVPPGEGKGVTGARREGSKKNMSPEKQKKEDIFAQERS